MALVTLTIYTLCHTGNIEVLKIIASKNKKYLSQETADGKHAPSTTEF